MNTPMMDAVTAWRNGAVLSEMAFTSADVETYRAVYVAKCSGTIRPRVELARKYSIAIDMAIDDAEYDQI